MGSTLQLTKRYAKMKLYINTTWNQDLCVERQPVASNALRTGRLWAIEIDTIKDRKGVVTVTVLYRLLTVTEKERRI